VLALQISRRRPKPALSGFVGNTSTEDVPKGQIVQQAEAICNEEATKSANAGVTLLMQLAILNSTLHSCMAKQGYLSLMQ
jgi:hypothetical protein